MGRSAGCADSSKTDLERAVHLDPIGETSFKFAKIRVKPAISVARTLLLRPSHRSKRAP
jgi:hypothetical protein